MRTTPLVDTIGLSFFTYPFDSSSTFKTQQLIAATELLFFCELYVDVITNGLSYSSAFVVNTMTSNVHDKV